MSSARHDSSQAVASSELHIFAPGMWRDIHETALKDPPLCMMLIKFHSLNFFCEHCRGHMLNYIQQHPMDARNLFPWTVDFHNSVNRRLGKKLMTLEEALAFYSRSSGECSACTVSEYVVQQDLPKRERTHPGEADTRPRHPKRVNPYTQR